MIRNLAIAVAVALAGIGVFAAISVGDENSTRPASFDRSFERVAAHPTDAPSASASASARARAKGRPKVKYLETPPVTVPAGRADFVTGCPRKHKVLSGYYLTSVASGAIVPDISAVSEQSLRDWTFGFVNDTGADGNAIIGVVCGKKL
jgi:hypothetical protein